MNKISNMHRYVLLALAAMIVAGETQAACVDNGDTTHTCTGTSENVDAYMEGTVTLDSSGGPAILSNITTDPYLQTGPGFSQTVTVHYDGYWDWVYDDIIGDWVEVWVDSPYDETNTEERFDFGAIIRNFSNSVSAASTIVASGSNPVTINNIGGRIEMLASNPITFEPNRTFDPLLWSNDAVGKLYNNGVLVGMAAAISAGPEVSSLTVNNFKVTDGDFAWNPIPSRIGGFGDFWLPVEPFTAGIYTNAPVLEVNNTGNITSIYSFGGANYTPPAVLDGTQYATVTSAGITRINTDQGGYIDNVYVVDRDPVLTQAQQQAADAGIDLALAYDTNAVGPRNSLINVGYNAGIGNLYLGSGAHEVNIANEWDGLGIGQIFVDQSDSEVVEVTGGVANTLYKVHGDRTFTLNSYNQYGSNITLNDVAGAVNTLNFFSYGQAGNIVTANGLGNNTMNATCAWSPDSHQPDLAKCLYASQVTGMTTINLMGELSMLDRPWFVDEADNHYFHATDAINLLGTHYLSRRATLTAPTIMIGSGASLNVQGNEYRDSNLVIGDIYGNLVNNGSIQLGDATLDVMNYIDPLSGEEHGGNTVMNPGSTLKIGIGLERAGYLNTTGTALFSPYSKLMVNVKQGVFVRHGDSWVIANNVSGLPAIQNGTGFVQWNLSEAAGDLLLSANVGISGPLVPLVTPAARNAANAFFASPGEVPQLLDLMAELMTLEGDEVVRSAERLRPEINDGAIRMALGNTDKLFGILDSRLSDSYLAASRTAGAGVLVASRAGNVGVEEDVLSSGKGIWVQGFGDRGNQEAMDGADGYDASSVGMAAGADMALDDAGNTRVGVAFGYARGNITNSGYTVNNRIDTNSYMGMMYGSHNYESWYLNGVFGVGRHVYDSHRQLLQHSAIGNHDSWQVAARVNAGWPMLFGDSLTFIPMASFDYSHISESGYRERGKSSSPLQQVDTVDGRVIPIEFQVPSFDYLDSPINLNVDGRDVDSYRVGLGGKMLYTLQEPDWAAEFELRAMLRHELGDIAQNTTARFALGGDSFKSPGVKPERTDLQLGGTVRLVGDDENDQLSLLTSYDAGIREKYFGQTVTLNVRYDFDQAPRYTRRAKERLAQKLERRIQEIFVTATEKDIAEINLAMQGGEDAGSEDDALQQAVNATIANWIKAQSNKNLDVYFNSYAANFATPDGSSRQQWERKRKSEIARQPNADIKVSYLTVRPNGDKAMAVFTQTSGEETVQKIVDLEQRGDRWLIVREDSIAMAD